MTVPPDDDYSADDYEPVQHWPEGWPETPATGWRTDPRKESVAWCRKTHGLWVDRATRNAWTWPRPCKSWDCSRCAVEKARRHLHHLHALFGSLERVWYGFAEHGTERVRRTATQRARRKAQRRGAKVGTVVIRHRNGAAHIFSTDDSTDGTSVVGQALRPEAARQALRRMALVVGQVVSWGVSYSDSWREPEEERKGDSVYIGHGTGEQTTRARELAEERIGREYGRGRPPPDVAIAIYEEALREAKCSYAEATE